jgi:(1->4)-alpha-D-glucan 1-alpha-D-glucosylmutase
LHLVDPDNRSPVDFEKRACLLASMTQAEASDRAELLRDILSNWRDGRIKFYITLKALEFRRKHQALFLEGTYSPLQTVGTKKENIVAFCRRRKTAWVVAAVPRLPASLVAPEQMPLGRPVWGNTALRLPDKAPRNWVNVITGETITASLQKTGHKLIAAEMLTSFPVALLAAA